MRAFIAIDISDEVRAAVCALAGELRKRVTGARWVLPENLHLTLRFLGEAEERLLEEMSTELVSTTARFAPFHLEFRGIGAFPSPRRPRVLSATVARPPEELARLHEHLEALARKHGFRPEERAFSPHLTFARLRKPGKELRLIQSELGDRALGVALIEEVVLFRSILKPTGAIYHALARFPLRGAAS
jgi:2'-5' RNA ligase